MIVVVMGVAGTGKSSVGRRLAEALDVPFVEGDDFHDRSSIEKMRRGQPLGDDDREPWIERLNTEIRRLVPSGAVLACSALTERSRRRLVRGVPDVRLVFLYGDEALLRSRLEAREDHFAGAGLLTSQLEALEAPANAAVEVDVAQPLDVVVAGAVAALRGE